ncbi:Opacity protein [Rhodovulum sp. ES.010]|uniref:outer membrane protein n=1 Tax=Rhodovulum sp. ES.010 TaxID=1882821 RepID=UPI0009263CBD|nr:porin family protein [Rhodovulum sp. ES.010]SIO21989.1 Opacity protein [Rhodovulum sp. ES.010]
MTKLTATAVLLLSTTGAAFAAGPEPMPPQPMVAAPASAPAVSWDGPYAGGQLGYAFGDFSLDPGDFDDDSIIGGFHIGYRFGLGNGWYLGPEFQYDWADLTVESLGQNVDFDEMARLKLVAGREVGPRGLMYGSIGYAYGDYGDPGDLLDASNDSWLAGFGYDYSLGNNWTIGGEYQYHDFNDVEVQTIHLKVGFQF